MCLKEGNVNYWFDAPFIVSSTEAYKYWFDAPFIVSSTEAYSSSV